MGSSGSKASRAAGAAARQYPKQPLSNPPPASNAPAHPPPLASNRTPGPTVRPRPQASGTRTEAVNLDASDPDFARSLRSLGPVQPNPTLSPSSAFPNAGNANAAARANAPDPRRNPALLVLEARSRLQDEADKEFMDAGRRGHGGRQFLDVYTIRQMLMMRDERGEGAAEIEKSLGLKSGTVDRLGPKGVLSLAQEVGRAQKHIDMV